MLRASLLPASLLAALTGLAPVAAQSVLVPASAANARGTTGLNTLTREQGNARTYQLGISASQLVGVPAGSVINGMSFRMAVSTANPAAWPSADVSFADYEIRIGTALPITNFADSFQGNYLQAPQLVRDGALVMPAAKWSNTSSLPAPQANPFADFYFDFQVPWFYAGGDVAITITHVGSSATNAAYFDAISSSPASGFTALSANSFNAATGTSVPFIIPRLHYGYGVGCPGTEGRVPNLVLRENVTSGGTLHMELTNGLPNALSVIGLGLSRTNIALPFGCTLLTSTDVTLFTALDGRGQAVYELVTVPLLSFPFYSQGGVFDPTSLLGYTLSNGVSPTIL